MISLHIEGETGEQVREQLAGLFPVIFGATPIISAVGQVVEDKPKPTRSRKPAEAKTEEAPETSAVDPSTPTAGTADSSSADNLQAGSQSPAGEAPVTPPSDDDTAEIDIVELKQRALSYSQKAGPVALTEILANAGKANGVANAVGKFSEVDGNQPALRAVSAALKAAGY